MALSFGFALPNAGNNFRGDIFSQLLPADQRVEAASGTQEVANGCLDNRVVELRAIVPEVTNTNLLFNSSMAGATGSVLPTNWASGSVSGLTYTISSASTVQGFRSIEWTVSGTALSDGDLWLACEPMVSGSVVAQIPSEYVGSMYCAKVSGTIKAGMVLQTLTQNFVDGAVQETKTKDLAAVTGQTFVRIEPNSVKTDIDLENRVNLRLYQPIANGEAVDFTIRVAAPQVEAGFVASPFISTVSGAVSEVRGRPSILVVPQLTRAGFVYPQLPVVSGADFTFTRATTATRVNASGLIESVASGVLRLDYPIGGGCPAGLIEPSAQNLCLQSEAWVSGNNWALTDVTNVTGATSAPNGTATANALSPTAVSDRHFVFSNATTTVSYASGTIYTQSAFFKAGTGAAGQFVQLTFPSARFTQAGYANFDLIAGTVSVVSGSSADANRAARIENYGNGWYRCIFTATCDSSGTGAGLIISLITSTGSGRTPTFTGVTGDVLYGWGAQVETGAIPTSYIPTTAASATRAAEVCTVSGVSGYIGQTQGTIYAEVDVARFTQNSIISISDGTVNNRIQIGFQSTTQLYAIISVIGANNNLISTIPAVPSTGGVYKIALAYKENDYCFAINGTTAASTASRLVPSCNKINLGSIFNDTGQLNDRIRAAAIYTTRLSNDQLANITRLT
jgi:hypothetical protein